jgi:hypothetical protein
VLYPQGFNHVAACAAPIDDQGDYQSAYMDVQARKKQQSVVAKGTLLPTIAAWP